ncbi:GNAT family N-acetyltransferase [Micromonospora ureilytica]|uniref:Ribosomal protein S18 acetylase RimI-like enzyme n=1 Tax=Micromonospora ureilytica TaxID=709868 RepID=A0ABS0JET0_9ACTN|nr:GNAT family N-acetyltransferase [Micromonospora ureilytica]MBG6064991.1 ribosomal protein S18 acetylase RimI-like enzyme [Micromonospora ureilytica]
MGTPVMIRQATPVDVEGIVEVHTQARTAYYIAGGISPDDLADPAQTQQRHDGWARAIHSPGRVVKCATQDGMVVGILSMGRPNSPTIDARTVGQLYQIHVIPSHWGNGIGARLHTSFVDYLTDSALPTGLLEVWQRNTRAQSFYSKLGWKPDGNRRPGPDGIDCVFLRLAATAAR